MMTWLKCLVNFMYQEKIIDIDNLSEKMSKRDTLCISSCSGSFDLLHSGHISYLTEAKSKGDILVVFLNSDNSIRLYKGPSRPITNLRNRLQLLSALECVDYIVPFDELTPISLIEKLKPDVFCNGADWGINPVEKSTVESYGGRLEIVSPETRDLISTSTILKKIQSVRNAPEQKVLFLDRDGVLIVDKGYIHKSEDVEIIPETVSGLQKLKSIGWEFCVISNQSGVGRGMYTEKEVNIVNNHISKLLKKDGLTIKKFYYCIHTPKDLCECRKPHTGLLVKAAHEFGIALGKSWMIGDKLSDIEAGRRANMHTIYIGNVKKDSQLNSLTTPEAVAKNLNGAADFILNFNLK